MNLYKIKELQKELEKLNKPKGWKPEYKEEYFYVDDIGVIQAQYWEDDKFDNFRNKTRNCFKTKEEAEEELARILFVNEVRDFIEEDNNGWEPEWNRDLAKFMLKFDGFVLQTDVKTQTRLTSKYKYFKSKEIGEKIIAKFDNQKLIKYWI